MRALGEPIQQAKWRAPEDRAIDVKRLFYLFLLLQNNLYEPIFSNKSTLLPIFARILALPLMAKLSPEARARLEAFKAIKVKHPRLEDVDRQVTQAIEEHAGYTHLLVYGPSGVGKSTVTRRIAERFVMEETNRAIVPVVWVEARPSDTGVYARLDYYRQVLSSLREHAAVKDHLMQVALAPRAGRKQVDAVEYAFERLQVKAVVIDEAQHLM
jgi:hypothetical protein